MIYQNMLLGLLLLAALPGQARETYNFNSSWRIDNQKKTVTLPHAWNEDEAFRVSTYDISTGVVWYRKHFRLPASAWGKKVFIEFEGARSANSKYGSMVTSWASARTASWPSVLT